MAIMAELIEIKDSIKFDAANVVDIFFITEYEISFEILSTMLSLVKLKWRKLPLISFF